MIRSSNKQIHIDKLCLRANKLSARLALNNTALSRKALGLSYTAEDIIPYKKAKEYHVSLDALKTEIKEETK